MAIQFDRFYRYAEFTQLLKDFASRYPDLIALESAGKSFEGRDIWIITATNRKTGAAEDKPAFWVDANIHAAELAGSAACLYLIDKLTGEYGKNADVTRCLDSRVMYLCPRINPDGAEWAMADTPRIIRSSTRPYPYDEDNIEGLAIGGALHKVQKAWVDHEVPQCGYCQSGQIMQAAALLAKNKKPSREQIVAHMSGNLCRCGTYNGIVAAIQRAAKQA